jgi:C2 domain
MPSRLRVKVVEGRDLPEMDRNYVKGELYTDAYVDIKFRHFEYRTQVTIANNDCKACRILRTWGPIQRIAITHALRASMV